MLIRNFNSSLVLRSASVEPCTQCKNSACGHCHAGADRPVLGSIVAFCLRSWFIIEGVKWLQTTRWSNKRKWCKICQFEKIFRIVCEGVVGHPILQGNIGKIGSILRVHNSVQSKGQLSLQNEACGVFKRRRAQT